jgi:hypothetical protein
VACELERLADLGAAADRGGRRRVVLFLTRFFFFASRGGGASLMLGMRAASVTPRLWAITRGRSRNVISTLLSGRSSVTMPMSNTG